MPSYPVKTRVEAEAEIADIGEWPINERRRSAVLLLVNDLREAERKLGEVTKRVDAMEMEQWTHAFLTMTPIDERDR